MGDQEHDYGRTRLVADVERLSEAVRDVEMPEGDTGPLQRFYAI